MTIKTNRFLEQPLSLSVESLHACDKKPIEIQIHLSPVRQRQHPVLTEAHGIHRPLGFKHFTTDLIILRLVVWCFLLMF
jgi:hypothetical protein